MNRRTIAGLVTAAGRRQLRRWRQLRQRRQLRPVRQLRQWGKVCLSFLLWLCAGGAVQAQIGHAQLIPAQITHAQITPAQIIRAQFTHGTTTLPAPPANAAQARVAVSTQYQYGADAPQSLQFWRASAAAPAPLIVFVHGGGWKRGDKDNATGIDKVRHFLDAGYAFASINYRLVPAASVEQQAADVSAAVAWLRAEAELLGIDPTRVVLMGHSAGAHLVALVGTDPHYLAAAGMALSDIRGIVALDGAAYDIPRQLADSGPLIRRTYVQGFGSDVQRQRALSPAWQAGAPNAPAFLLLHADRADGKTQAAALAAALRRAGTRVELADVGGSGLRGHMAINRSLGQDDGAATAVVDDWLRALWQAH